MLPFAVNIVETGSVEAELLDLMLRAGSRWVLWLLIGLSLMAVSVILERVVFYVLERSREELLRKAISTMKGGDFAAAGASLKGVRSMQAAVARACLENASSGAASVEELAAGVTGEQRLRYERGLAFLGTLGNNAPFIGLFGTVLGIIRAFHDLSLNTASGSSAVMAGIAEALVATGVGLLVALPAVAAYNGFARYVESTMTGAEAITHTILAEIKVEKAPAPTSAPTASPPQGQATTDDVQGGGEEAS